MIYKNLKIRPVHTKPPAIDAISNLAPASLAVSWLMPLAPMERPEFLATTLASLEGQSLQANELVIAADGPLPNGLREVIAASRLPIRLVEQSRPAGIGALLQVVAPQCRGSLILRIDSDDLYHRNHTADVLAALEAHPQAGAVGTQLIELEELSGRFSSRRTPTEAAEVQRWLPWRNPMNHQTVGMRKQALLEAGGYRHSPGFEDWDLWLRIAAQGHALINLPMATVAARVNRQHRLRRRGWRYFRQELNFYRCQLSEGRVEPRAAVTSLLTRLPVRLAPMAVLRWWMESRWRGSPPLDTAWVSELLAQNPWVPGLGNPQQRRQ
jgi:hypothetical protein